MTALVIWASPNTDGLTAAAKNQLIKGLAASGVMAEVVHLNRLKMARCRTCGDGWGICRTRGQCVIEDDFAALYRQMVSVEGIVWVTPVYWHDLAECLKAFLDRLRRCETGYAHALKGKPNLLVACAGGTGRGAVECLRTLEDTLRHMEMVAADRLPVTRFNRAYMLPALSEAGKAFGQALAAASAVK